jgi:hypothetical protein
VPASSQEYALRINITDVGLIRQLTALADNDNAAVAHVVEYACYRYLLELVNDCPNIVHAVPELAQ